jgi:choline dehydrogenase-like flavoprotein
MSASIRKLRPDFEAPAKNADIVVLYPSSRASNEEIRQRQYAAQKAMLEANLASGAFEMAITPDMLAVRQQPVRNYSQTYIDQARLQGEKGWAFKI